MAVRNLTAHQDEPLDALLWRELGRSDGLEAVLNANPGVAQLSTALPEGHQVLAPDAAQAVRTQTLIQLWD
ncbi:MAG: tail protein X [Phenylobacterium sp.]|nr:tail protein X [Phenylobacterium sp.]